MEQKVNELLPSAGSVNYKAEEADLTEEEMEAVLKSARIKKASKIKQIEYFENLRKPIEYPKLTTEDYGSQILKLAKATIKGFVLDNQNEEIFKLLCQYFTQDPGFEKEGYSLKKGLILFGPIGCGKTSLMRLFKRNPTNDFVVRSCREVADDYTKKDFGGAESLDRYSDLVPCYQHEHYGQTHLGMCFDDLGTEKNKKHFGNEINVMEDVFQNRYDKGLIGKTHLTTNLDSDQIGEIYGDRVRSRLREMCNSISFDEKAFDRRI